MSDNLIYLFAAFAATWIVLFLYSFFLARRQREIEREIEVLRDHIQSDQGEGERRQAT